MIIPVRCFTCGKGRRGEGGGGGKSVGRAGWEGKSVEQGRRGGGDGEEQLEGRGQRQ